MITWQEIQNSQEYKEATEEEKQQVFQLWRQNVVDEAATRTYDQGGGIAFLKGMGAWGGGVKDTVRANLPNLPIEEVNPFMEGGFTTMTPEEKQSQMADIEQNAAEREGIEQTRGGYWGGIAASGTAQMALPQISQVPGFGSFIKRLLWESGKSALTEMAPYGGDKTIQGVTGALGGLAGETIGTGFNKTVNAIRGKMANPADEELIRLGKEHDVRVGYADLPSAGQTPKKIVGIAEKIPLLGPTGFRKGQVLDSDDAVRGFVESLNPPGGRLNVLDTTLTMGEKNTELVASVNRAYKKATTDVSMAYSEIPVVARYNGIDIDKDAIVIPNTKQALEDLINSYPDVFERLGADKKIKDYLEETFGKIEGREIVTKHGVQDAKFSFTDLTEGLDKQLNKLIGDAKRKGERDILRKLYAVKTATMADLDTWVQSVSTNWAKTGGGGQGRDAVLAAWNEAKESYVKGVVPFHEEGTIDAILANKFDPDRALVTWVKKNAPARAKEAMGILDLEGRELLQAETMARLYKSATVKGQFLPGKFADEVEKMGGTWDTLLDSSQKEELMGMAKLMRAVEESGKSRKTGGTSSGFQILGGAAIGGMGIGAVMAHPYIAGGILTGTLASAHLFTSRTGRNLLAAASRAPTKRMGFLLKRAEKLLQGMGTDFITNEVEESTRR